MKFPNGFRNPFKRGQAGGFRSNRPAAAVPDLHWDKAICRICRTERVFTEMLGITGEVRGANHMARILLYELPDNGKGDSAVWSHAMLLHMALSKDKPRYLSESMCPNCNPYRVGEEFRAEQWRAMEEMKSKVKRDRMRVDQCCDCKETRAGVQIGVSGGFGTSGNPLAAIHLFEIDGVMDLLPPGSIPPQRWLFTGVLDLQAGLDARQYRWRATCPKCQIRRNPEASKAPIVLAPASEILTPNGKDGK